MTDYAVDFKNPRYKHHTTVQEMIAALSTLEPETVLDLTHGIDQVSFSATVYVRIPLSAFHVDIET